MWKPKGNRVDEAKENHFLANGGWGALFGRKPNKVMGADERRGKIKGLKFTKGNRVSSALV